jgi:hypothetical protein
MRTTMNYIQVKVQINWFTHTNVEDAFRQSGLADYFTRDSECELTSKWIDMDDSADCVRELFINLADIEESFAVTMTTFKTYSDWALHNFKSDHEEMVDAIGAEFPYLAIEEICEIAEDTRLCMHDGEVENAMMEGER